MNIIEQFETDQIKTLIKGKKKSPSFIQVIL